MANDHDLDNEDESTPKKVDKSHQPAKNDTPKKAKRDERTLMPHHDDDEDDYYPEKNWRGGDSKYPPSWTLYEKMSKEEAQYKKGVPFQSCGKCSFYQSGHCKIIRGYISAEMRCRYYQEKYGAVVFSTIRVSRK